MSAVLDPRLNAFRPDLADEALKDIVNARRYGKGKLKQIAVPLANLYSSPDVDGFLSSQLLLGSLVQSFDEDQGFCWVQSVSDRYVGYVASASLTDVITSPTHIVSVPRTFIYERADLRQPMRTVLSLGCKITLVGQTETRNKIYGLCADGSAILFDHIKPVARPNADYVAIAEKLIYTPYLWGGASAFGIDCSALVQLALAMAGKSAPRDSDMQYESIGYPLGSQEERQRGDLVFWPGHVAIMVDGTMIIHANGASMDVAIEPLASVSERIYNESAHRAAFKRISINRC